MRLLLAEDEQALSKALTAILERNHYSVDAAAYDGQEALAYGKQEAGQSLDVQDVAAQGLSSVVAVTNISVQEVQSFFAQFGRNGRGQTHLQETTSCGSGVILYRNDLALYWVTNYHVVEGAIPISQVLELIGSLMTV